ncbi:hypothetical protein M9Y10_014258 [Tritrichomonas musculus]|uniref:Phage protein n=1 Tax=Tritrichomonas musculus TaxID=1915356 RepID=A0ABR2L071_9EUKA
MANEIKITFRAYEPQTEELKNKEFYTDPVNLEPYEALSMVDSIIQSSIDEAPDLEKTNISLAPRRSDVDLKRIMKPEIDELIDETKATLINMKKKMKK